MRDSLTSGIAILLSVIAIIASTIIGIRQALLMQRTNLLMHYSNLLPILNESLREFREPNFRNHMQYIRTRLWDRCSPERNAVRDLPEEAREHAIPVITFFGHIGTLLANRLIDQELISSYMAVAILEAWKYLGPYIRNERRYIPSYHLFFENLAAVVKEYPSGELRTRFDLKTMPE